MINKSVTLEELIQMVNSALPYVESGEKFIVRDLFRGFEWNRIPRALRTKLGSMILILSGNGGLSSSIKPIGKTPQNQQIYIKK